MRVTLINPKISGSKPRSIPTQKPSSSVEISENVDSYTEGREKRKKVAKARTMGGASGQRHK